MNYGTTTAYGSSSTVNTTLVTSHSVTLTGLTAGTKYNFDVVSANSANTTATSPNATFTTVVGTPVISAVTATSVSSTSETITWTTDQATTSLVNYGATTAYGSSSTVNTTLATSHSVTLTGLTAGTTYNFECGFCELGEHDGHLAEFDVHDRGLDRDAAQRRLSGLLEHTQLGHLHILVNRCAGDDAVGLWHDHGIGSVIALTDILNGEPRSGVDGFEQRKPLTISWLSQRGPTEPLGTPPCTASQRDSDLVSRARLY